MAGRLIRSWKRFPGSQVHGSAGYQNWTTDLLVRSYYELGVFPHSYLYQGQFCKSHVEYQAPTFIAGRHGVSALEFDNQGKYFAAGTKEGCVTVYDFESLYSHTQDEEDQTKQVFHESGLEMKEITAIKWNPVDQNEIAWGSRKLNYIQIFDVSSSIPKLRCRKRDDNEDWLVGFYDVAFASTDPSRIVASDFQYRTVAIWDTRAGGLPIRELQLDHGEATCLQYSESSSNQHLWGGGTDNSMRLWDLRGGVAPIGQWHLVELMTNQHLTVGHAGRHDTRVDSIGFNPSNQRQLAFHLHNGWSGVFDVPSSSITHIHRPHALAGLDEACRDPFYTRRCSWLSNTSIYMAPSRNERGIFLLDFHRSTSSPYHVDSVWGNQNNNRGFVALSDTIITCSAHPQYDVIVAGTEDILTCDFPNVQVSERRGSIGKKVDDEEEVGENVGEEEDVADEEEEVANEDEGEEDDDEDVDEGEEEE